MIFDILASFEIFIDELIYNVSCNYLIFYLFFIFEWLKFTHEILMLHFFDFHLIYSASIGCLWLFERKIFSNFDSYGLHRLESLLWLFFARTV